MKRKQRHRVGPLQLAVRQTRHQLAIAEQYGDRPAIIACIAELRAHADRADEEGKQGAFTSPAVILLRDLADKTEAKLWQHKLQS